MARCRNLVLSHGLARSLRLVLLLVLGSLKEAGALTSHGSLVQLGSLLLLRLARGLVCQSSCLARFFTTVPSLTMARSATLALSRMLARSWLWFPPCKWLAP